MVSDKLAQPASTQTGKSVPIFIPETYRVEIKLDGRSDVDAVGILVQQTFGANVPFERRITGRMAGRSSIFVGSFPREIAEAKVEMFRSRARLGRVQVQAVICRI